MNMSTHLPKSTIVYFIRGAKGKEEIFLGEKFASPKAIKRKIAGKLMSYGGDMEETDATVTAGLKRELEEESGFIVSEEDLEVMAKIYVLDENGPRLILYYLFARKWSGEPTQETDIINPQWHTTNPLPENILEADKLILPLLFSGMKLEGHVTYDADMNIVKYSFTPVGAIK